jgi:hypothetical protein
VFSSAQQRLLSELKRSEALQMTALLLRVPTPEKTARVRESAARRPSFRRTARSRLQRSARV